MCQIQLGHGGGDLGISQKLIRISSFQIVFSYLSMSSICFRANFGVGMPDSPRVRCLWVDIVGIVRKGILNFFFFEGFGLSVARWRAGLKSWERVTSAREEFLSRKKRGLGHMPKILSLSLHILCLSASHQTWRIESSRSCHVSNEQNEASKTRSARAEQRVQSG
jgi:hypothetical protein